MLACPRAQERDGLTPGGCARRQRRQKGRRRHEGAAPRAAQEATTLEAAAKTSTCLSLQLMPAVGEPARVGQVAAVIETQRTRRPRPEPKTRS